MSDSTLSTTPRLLSRGAQAVERIRAFRRAIDGLVRGATTVSFERATTADGLELALGLQ
ncbi:hypothetical protein WMF31_12890 [Sorangium sp. So ce1036]|uniref:hypothetical protein n=1 Tax=Sorangium sp. So ce1036 TaxID=3133328 RepID=UPI003F0AC2CD